MRNTLQIVCLNIFFLMIFIYGCTNKEKIEKPSAKLVEQTVVNDNPDCVEFVALWPAGDVAGRIGKDKKWVFLNYTVDLWDIPPSEGIGKNVGKLRASSYARIIQKKGTDYKVESPVDQTQGWLSKKHVKSISRKNPKTRALCE